VLPLLLSLPILRTDVLNLKSKTRHTNPGPRKQKQNRKTVLTVSFPLRRQRMACLRSGRCSKSSRAMQRFERLLMQVPEHTAGVAHFWFLMDNENYTNAQFDRARAQQPQGFVADNRKHADYNSSVNSWLEQRAFVTQAPALLEAEYPELAANITAALDVLQARKRPFWRHFILGYKRDHFAKTGSGQT
jgi:hypothetical protein